MLLLSSSLEVVVVNTGAIRVAIAIANDGFTVANDGGGVAVAVQRKRYSVCTKCTKYLIKKITSCVKNQK
ncbi:hypothetical protein HanIR_Chr11g0558791 [Helianthus annuus]|nr:hypothetical protein HanIR_Chr11g0558791 [Helianthus annuus]